MDAADLVTLAFSLYVDSLPAPVIEALERIAAHRQGRDPSRRQLFTAIANCGFPEAYQCATALAMCKAFAREAGFAWAGALELAAEGLVEGSAIPNAARDGLAKPIIPHWMYWLVSCQRWYLDAKHYSAVRLLMRKPYLTKAK